MVLCGLLKAKKPMLWLRSPQLVVGKVGAKTTGAPWPALGAGDLRTYGMRVRVHGCYGRISARMAELRPAAAHQVPSCD